jgi:hypothetical protein
MSNNNWNGEGLPSVGQMVLNKRFSTEDPVELVALDSYQFCSKTAKGFLSLHNIKDMLPIPTPTETAKQKAIQEIQQSINACLQKGLSTGESVYMDGYRKVKPLSFDEYGLLTICNTYLKDYEALIENGYCIGSEE